jgi:endo-1,4-beta-xylanase
MEDLLDSPNPPAGRKTTLIDATSVSPPTPLPPAAADVQLFDNNDDDDLSDNDVTVKQPISTLKGLARKLCKSIDIGTAVMPGPLFHADNNTDDGAAEDRSNDNNTTTTIYARILEQEFNSIVVEHHLKWAPLLRGGDGAANLSQYDFTHADSIVEWALQRKIKVKGHVLVWAVTSPMVIKDLSCLDLREQLKRHIFTVMGHYRGRIHEWDVVNEPLAPDGSLAKNVFLQKLGLDYVELAFQWAHEADPTAVLILNENKVEGIVGAKSDCFYELVADLVAKGVPLHGVGLQAHLNAAGTGRHRCPTPRMIKQQIRRFGDLGLKVNISEMDVRVSQLPAELRQKAQRQVYHDVLAAAMTEPSFTGVWLWG